MILGILVMNPVLLQAQSLLEQKVKLVEKEGISLQQVIDQIIEKTGTSITYSASRLPMQKQVVFSGKEITVKDYLELALKDTRVRIMERRGKIILVPRLRLSLVESRKSTRFTLSGYIRDASSLESLIGATLYEPKELKGTSSNVYGFYSISLPAGKYVFIISYVGYKTRKIVLDLNGDITQNILLNSSNELGEVMVTAFDKINSVDVNRMSVNQLVQSDMRSLPLMLGEKDVIRTIRLYPGIQSGGSSRGLFVRGGGPDQNLMLLDGVPIYNSNHLMGFLSIYSGVAVNSAEVVKGGFPARYGGRLSSVVDVRMKEGDMNSLHGEVALGFLASKIWLEGPIRKGKTSFSLSARRTWADLLLNRALRSSSLKANYNFHDINAKVNHRFSNRSRLYLSYYRGNDNLLIDDQEPDEDFSPQYKNTLGWGNRIFSSRWNYVINPTLFSNLQVTYSKYQYNLSDIYISDTKEKDPKKVESYDFKSRSDIEDFGIRNEYDYLPDPDHYVKFGVGYIHHVYHPVIQQQYDRYGDVDIYENVESGREYANEYFLFGEDDIKISDCLKVNPGIHMASFHVGHKSYFSIQPRFNVLCKINTLSSLKVSYSKMTQFIHLLSNPGIGLPSDMWVPCTSKVKPEHAHQIAVGYTRLLPWSFQLNIETYYKWMRNLIDYHTASSYYTSKKDWEQKVTPGKGWSYGVEVMLERKIGKTTGWISYTLSSARRKFKRINFGRPFNYRYDRRHDLSVATSHKRNERFDVGMVFLYGSGHALTMGLDRYRSIENLEEDNNWGNIRNVEQRNNYRLPSFHRMDVAANFHKKKKHGKRTWTVGVFNVYNHSNPFMYYLDEKENGGARLSQMSLSPILPYVSYTYSF